MIEPILDCGAACCMLVLENNLNSGSLWGEVLHEILQDSSFARSLKAFLLIPVIIRKEVGAAENSASHSQ